MAHIKDIKDIHGLGAEKGFKLVHWNVRSLVKKIDQLRTLIVDSPIDVLTISESWLKSHLHSNIISVSGFEVFRQDRGVKPKSKKRGGGLLTYVNKKHSSHCEPLLDLSISNEDIEVQWILIHRLNCKNVIICNVYRPPNGNLNKAIEYLDDCLKTLNMSKLNLFIMGDLNVNYQNKSSACYKKLHFFVQSNSLSQLISNTTRNTDKSKSLIDLAMTNSKFVSKSGTLDHYMSDHQPIYLVHKKGRDVRQSVKFEGRSYRSFKQEAFREALLELDWREFYSAKDPGTAWNFIATSITQILDTMCPVRSFHIKNYRPSWITNELLEQIKDRDYFYSKAKQTDDVDAWNIAKFLRNKTNVNIRKAKREFILDELEANANNCKKFWKVIREVVPSNKKQDRQDILLKDGDRKVEKEDVAGFINDFFINVGNVSPTEGADISIVEETVDQTWNDNVSVGDSPEINEFRRISKSEVHRVVKDINVSKSSGLTNISSFIIKEAFLAILPEVTHLFNLSLETSTFPVEWRKAMVVPIPKTGDLTSVQNYRPISLLPLPGKILEKLVHFQLTDYLEKNSLLAEIQHGFRSNHSTIHSVAQFTNYISTKQDIGLPTLATYIDFKKAFDCVQHPTLLKKLKRLNFGDKIVGWVESYLSSRLQRVYANDVYSTYLTVSQGVPQGSVLGPLFYIIYANDLVDTIKHCKVALYADDTVLYIANSNFDLSVSRMQKDIDSISAWCNTNGIFVNTGKSKVMTLGSKYALKRIPAFQINLGGVPLQNVSTYKYLGITIDCNLNYNLHVNKIVATVSNKLKQFQRMRSFLNVRAALLVYKSMMLPILEYGDVLLTATTVKNRKRLQVLQNKGLRCALGLGYETSTEELHTEANLLMLKHRRELHVINFMYGTAIRDHNSKSALITSRIVTRSQKKRLLKVKRPKTERFKRSLAYSGPTKWNALPLGLHLAEDKWQYKKLTRNWIEQKALRSGYVVASGPARC